MYTFEIDYRYDEIKKYEMDIVSEDICKSFIPTSFIKDRDTVHALYSYDGFLKISQCRFREITQLLNLIERVITELVNSSSYYIDYTEISFSCDTVFYKEREQEVRLAFIPERNTSFNDTLIAFITELKENFNNASKEYLDILISYLKENNYSTDDICRKIRGLKKEITRLGIK